MYTEHAALGVSVSYGTCGEASSAWNTIANDIMPVAALVEALQEKECCQGLHQT